MIYTLANDGIIRDNGKTVLFGNNTLTGRIATLYASSRWGNKAKAQANQIVFAEKFDLSEKQNVQACIELLQE